MWGLFTIASVSAIAASSTVPKSDVSVHPVVIDLPQTRQISDTSAIPPPRLPPTQVPFVPKPDTPDIDFTLTDVKPYTANTVPVARIAVLLPNEKSVLGHAAAAFRAGFLAAYQLDNRALAVTIIDAHNTPEAMVRAYQFANQTSDLIVGPLSRTGWTAIMNQHMVHKPTIALTQPEQLATQTPASAFIMPIGLSLDAEARQMVDWLNTQPGIQRVLVLTTSQPWQARIASTFRQTAKMANIQTTLLDVSPAPSNTPNTSVSMDLPLDTQALQLLKQRLVTENAQAIFITFNHRQAAQLRQIVPQTIPIIGISQLNATHALQTDHSDALVDNVFFVDIPWLIDPHHPAVMTYPKFSHSQTTKNNDLERLYALGIDAFLVSCETVLHDNHFQLDGATGKLQGAWATPNTLPYFERIEPVAVFRRGNPVLWSP